MTAIDLPVGAYPLWEVETNEKAYEALVRTKGWFESAVAIDRDSSARWGLGRIQLMLGNASAAAEALEPIEKKGYRNPLLYLDLLTAYSQAQQHKQAIDFYEEGSCPIVKTRYLSNTLAVSYLGQAQVDFLEGQKQAAQRRLENAYSLHPGDLYAAYHLWQELSPRNIEARAAYSNTLLYFPLRAVHPADERLLDYALEVTPDLLIDGIWERDKASRVVEFWIWRYSENGRVEKLLKELIRLYPTEPRWYFYLAELYHRRGDLDRALSTYKQVLKLDPLYEQSYLRIALISEITRQDASSTLWWYERYYELAQDDLFGLRKLEGMYDAKDHQEAANLRQELSAAANDKWIVADRLGVPEEVIELGPNLLPNGELKWGEGRLPENWQISDMARGDARNSGLFLVGKDGLTNFENEENAVRIQGFWLQRAPKAPGRFGLRAWNEEQEMPRSVKLSPHSLYLIAVTYKTEDLIENETRIWLTGEMPEKFPQEPGLPSTQGRWQRFVLLQCNPLDASLSVSPIVRIWAPGRLWIDEVVLREVHLPRSVCGE
jgi:tetratricopeptide (TPR) repeat protein